MTKTIKQALEAALAAKMADEGNLVGLGAEIMLGFMEPPTPAAAEDLRYAFFAGAQHLYGVLMSVMDEGREPTKRDLERMEKVHDELDAWTKSAALRIRKASGAA